MQEHDAPSGQRPNDDGESSREGTSEQQGYEGAGVEEGGGYQRRAGAGGGYERSGTEDEDYDPRQEGGGN